MASSLFCQPALTRQKSTPTQPHPHEIVHDRGRGRGGTPHGALTPTGFHHTRMLGHWYFKSPTLSISTYDLFLSFPLPALVCHTSPTPSFSVLFSDPPVQLSRTLSLFSAASGSHTHFAFFLRLGCTSGTPSRESESASAPRGIESETRRGKEGGRGSHVGIFLARRLRTVWGVFDESTSPHPN